MKCPQCDAEVQQGSAYCSKCGERLRGPGAESFADLQQESSKPSTSAVQPQPPKPAVTADAAAAAAASVAQKNAEVTLNDQVTVWEGRYSLKGMIDQIFLSGIATVAIFVLAIWRSWQSTGWTIALVLIAAIWLYLFGLYFYRRLGNYYRLTPQTFFHECGLLVKLTSPIEIIRIDDISLNQSILERMLGVGTIRILSNDTTDPLLALKGIADVRKAFETIDQARRAERRRRAVRIDAV